MDPADAFYMVGGLPLVGLALHCWGRWAAKGGVGWIVAGVLVGAVGLDGLRLLLGRVDETPSPWPFWIAAAMLAVGIGSIARRVWKRISKAPRSAPTEPLLEAALQEALDEHAAEEHAQDS